MRIFQTKGLWFRGHFTTSPDSHNPQFPTPLHREETMQTRLKIGISTLKYIEYKINSPWKGKDVLKEEPAEWPIYPNQVTLEVSTDSLF